MNTTSRTVAFSALHDYPYLVFPNDLNCYGTVFGGRILEIADLCAGIVAHRHTGLKCVTCALDAVRFHAPARHGELIVFQAAINRAWNTSLEVGVKVWAELKGKRRHIASAYFTFVAVDDHLRPVPVPHIIPESEEEKRRYEEADARRRSRLT